ncbi:MAG: hypothetical protein IJE14_01740 [Clostridia bacterium]|nr:hypothetical protein [Clostridia bacterium]
MYYDTGAIRRTAADIRSELKTYTASKNKVELTIEGMNSYFSDPVQQDFVKRYRNELKETVIGIEKLMNQYADYLDECARAIDKAIEEGKSAING